jgi:hypothetical protein
MMKNRWISHLSSLKANRQYSRLAIEITVILIAKVILLYLLWWACFSHPIAKQDRQAAVTRIIMNTSK